MISASQNSSVHSKCHSESLCKYRVLLLIIIAKFCFDILCSPSLEQHWFRSTLLTWTKNKTKKKPLRVLGELSQGSPTHMFYTPIENVWWLCEREGVFLCIYACIVYICVIDTDRNRKIVLLRNRNGKKNVSVTEWGIVETDKWVKGVRSRTCSGLPELCRVT